VLAELLGELLVRERVARIAEEGLAIGRLRGAVGKRCLEASCLHRQRAVRLGLDAVAEVEDRLVAKRALAELRGRETAANPCSGDAEALIEPRLEIRLERAAEERVAMGADLVDEWIEPEPEPLDGASPLFGHA